MKRKKYIYVLSVPVIRTINIHHTIESDTALSENELFDKAKRDLSYGDHGIDNSAWVDLEGYSYDESIGNPTVEEHFDGEKWQ
jgi:hypothetical protein